MHSLNTNSSSVATVALGDYVMLSVRLQRWSGKSALAFDDDLGVSDEDEVLNGTKDICPRSILRPFNSLDQALNNGLEKIGVKFVPGIWAIPKSRISEADSLLEELRDRFDKAMGTFEAQYDEACDKFFDGKSIEDRLRASKLPLERVKKRFSLTSTRFQMAESGYNENISESALYDSFTLNIAKQAREAFKSWNERVNKDVLHEKSVNVLTMLRDKIRGFASLSPHAFALASHMDQVLDSLPLGKLEGVHVNNAIGLLLLLKDERSLKTFGGTLVNSLRTSQAVLSSTPDAEKDPQPLDVKNDILAEQDATSPEGIPELSLLSTYPAPESQVVAQQLVTLEPEVLTGDDDFILPDDAETVVLSAAIPQHQALALPLEKTSGNAETLAVPSLVDDDDLPVISAMTPGIDDDDDLPLLSELLGSNASTHVEVTGPEDDDSLPFIDCTATAGIPEKAPF